MKSIRKLVAGFVMAVVVSGSLAACNTMEGLGRDTQAAGAAITGSAKDNKGY